MQRDTPSEDGSPSPHSHTSETLIEPPPSGLTSTQRSKKGRNLGRFLVLVLALGGLGFQVIPQLSSQFNLHGFRPNPQLQVAPLAMVGGDPYVRALMRTISASEANDLNPYNLLYGGSRLTNYHRHPDICLAILTGPNIGQCTTAAGRYQFITTTWEEKAKAYHPNPSGLWIWTTYSFEPEYQDQVVYRWLSDRTAWGADVKQLLSQGDLPTVLRLLSGTWTSLGYGIENNDVTPYLGQVYDQVLSEELKLAQKRINTSDQ
jgi:muramidase (phage lysozyme)